jgi:hypothetical protein
MKKSLFLLLAIQLFLSAQSQLTATLSKAEKEGLLYMQEEEKLARDVYDSMYAKWEVNPFGNIRQSERVHMNRMNTLAVTYGIKEEKVFKNDQPGGFLDPLLASYYKALIKSGTTSLTEALKAGAKIEELDIADLDKRIAQTNKEDILTAYKFLRMGSENHLRAFTRRLKSQGVDYQPEFIKKEMFDAIISGENQEAGCGNGPGNGQGQGKGPGQGKGNGPGTGACKEKCCEKETGPGCKSN